ncbi:MULTISPECIES: helix-turn-helix domain-containing protein [Pseudomonas]|uniref:helix-turn-helix domain-containing protein n=1 Tax=Pseudomonas TaxID=286 RepID=UPI00045367C2|nr:MULTISPECIES: helix-turn-helix domain-containing protein [Pseudomonas]EIU2706482.1 helix-turn-helix domain-containing protein [Pseudomonas aeruginosa]EKU7685946.1 helix-turn-helix domain-containing protein [Pseudomonas aeruginosa]ELH1109326.1 helix-turn-helix domain-containing protein [Pseudomonas aeruginosa]ELT8145197.1 helix-turn-helix domain-containing protein [Pseudomonas aeruginosa]ELU0706707.1 helix-turn-helix domain-containing protein [Pseudomonas aeruginosa]
MTAATCGWVTMSMRELDRLKVIEAIIEGRLKPAAAAQRLRLTTRQVHRLVLRYREDGPAGLTSRRRGQPSNRQLSPGLENPAISLIRRNYSDFGPTLAQEKLVECHGLKLAKETVRRIMVDAGMWVPRKQRPPKVYQPRNRRACCGELIQIDDGKPLAFYSDKASVFRSNHKAPQGGDGYTQFGRAMYELNIESICANSSQAKGRVERANLTLQDRLVKELRLRGISNMPDANAFAAHFMASYNARFAKPPRSEHDCHRPLHSDEDLDLIFAWREARRVSQRLTVQYDKVLYLLADTPQSRRLAGDHVEIYHYPDGRIEPRVDGTALPFTTYDKLCEIDQGAIVENKRLGHVLQVAQLVQAQRDSRRSQSVPGNPRQSTQGKMLSKKAQRELMPEDIAAALDNTPPSRRSRHA